MDQNQISVEQFGSIIVYDDSEKAIQLSTLWQNETAVFVLVRHFGWVICRQQVAELADFQDDFSQRGAKLVIIGNGQVKDLKKFRKLIDYKGVTLTDFARESYKYLKFKSDLSDLLGVKSFTQTVSALKAGFKPGSLQGSALQLGGAIVVTAEGNIPYFFVSSAAGDHPPVEDLLTAVR